MIHSVNEASPLVPGGLKDRTCTVAWGFAAREPATEAYQAQNPTPLTLCLAHMASALLQIMVLLASYGFLVANAWVAFPRCSNLHHQDGSQKHVLAHSPSLRVAVCEACSVSLWNFPLVAAMLVLLAEQRGLCDSRFFFECLREKVMVDFPRKRFFTPWVLLTMTLVLALSATGLLFAVGESHKRYSELVLIVLVAALPLGAFLGAQCVAMDLKAQLLTLAQFSSEAYWAREHLDSCVMVHLREARLASRWLLLETNLPPEPGSAHVFHRLRMLAEKAIPASAPDGSVPGARNMMRSGSALGSLGAALAAEDGGTGGYADLSLTVSGRELALWHLHEESRDRSCCACGEDNSWVLDVLWLPEDDRGRQFRMGFRVFVVCKMIVEALLLAAIVITVLEYLSMQARVDGEQWRHMRLLKPYIIRHF